MVEDATTLGLQGILELPNPTLRVLWLTFCILNGLYTKWGSFYAHNEFLKSMNYSKLFNSLYVSRDFDWTYVILFNIFLEVFQGKLFIIRWGKEDSFLPVMYWWYTFDTGSIIFHYFYYHNVKIFYPFHSVRVYWYFTERNKITNRKG